MSHNSIIKVIHVLKTANANKWPNVTTVVVTDIKPNTETNTLTSLSLQVNFCC